MSQTLSNWDNYLGCLYVCRICHGICSTICLAGKVFKKYGLLEFGSSPPIGRPCNLIHSPLCRTPCRLFIHKVFFGPLGLWSFTFMCEVNLEVLRSFDQWELFSLVCELWSGPYMKSKGFLHILLLENFIHFLFFLRILCFFRELDFNLCRCLSSP